MYKKLLSIPLASLLVASMIVIGWGLGAAEAAEKEIVWEGVVSWPQGTLLHDMAVVFAEAVEKESGGKLKVSLKGPDAWPGPKQIEAVSDGVFDFCWTTTSYHLGFLPEGLFTAFMGGDRDKIRALGAHDLIDEIYADKFSTKLLTTFNEGLAHLFVFFKNPVETLSDFRGRKIRSADLWHPAIVAWGAEPIWMSDPEALDALMMGTIDGATTVTLNYCELGYTEVAPYLVFPPVSGTYGYAFASLDSWNALPEELKEAVKRAALVAESRNDELVIQKLKLYPKMWDEANVKRVILSEEDALKMTGMAQNGYLEKIVKPSVDPALYERIKKMIESSPPILAPDSIMP